ncbi:MAG: hypothetical protein P4L85_26405 [Paludisphaera borealis]|uniref:hypothetical protein n=1 Tax=Paludisphaera borealis TaxID=1387353 RepID=UPI002852026C|nr:hypothetical protein [Paludisphaera borealis]MDR3622914.1 hypothetical protein [Paludisphaera borealis]
MDSVSLLRRAAAPRVLLDAAVVAHGSARLTREEIAVQRRLREPLAEGWNPIGHATLRSSDDQTVAAVTALRAAIARADAPSSAYDGWGVLAAPRFLGRSKLVVVLDRFKAEGVWGVTPHLIPHFALHAQAGTLSLVLGGHGPNLGIGGGLFSASEGVLSALTWLASGVAPGVWLVLTGWSPEYQPDLNGEPCAATHCEALALALTPASDDCASRIKLQIVEAETARPPVPPTPEVLTARLERFVVSSADGPRLIGHEAHEGRSYSRPHLPGEPRRDGRFATIGTDASGRLLIELAAPRTSPLGETS